MMGELVAYQVAWMARLMPFVNIELDPDAINPYRPEAVQTPAPGSDGETPLQKLEAWQARFAWRARVLEAQKKGKTDAG